jgi:glucose-6-phosphate 1-dehydrogenase
MIEAGWAVIQPILDARAAGRGGSLHEYQPGSDGPEAADDQSGATAGPGVRFASGQSDHFAMMIM